MAWTTFKEIPWAFGNWYLLAHALTIRYTNNGNYFTVLLRYLHSSGSYSTLESDINLTSDFDYNKYRYRISLKNASSFGSVTHETKPTNGDFVASDTFNATINYTGVTILIEREEKNTAPTTPGAFVQPTGPLEIGDSKTISWGASTDAESNLELYILEASINGGPWAQIAATSYNNVTYKIPTATSIRFRVKARDATALESAYRESGTFTVQPPQYYWSKYTVGTYNSYYQSEWYREGAQNRNLQGLYKSYSLNTATGIFTVSGGTWDNSAHPLGATGYTASGTDVYKYVMRGDGISCDFYSSYSFAKAVETNGSLVQSGIIAGEGTYPTNGKHSDGFWYIRGSRVNQSIAPPQGITSPTADTVFRPGNTVNIAFTASTAANISSYEVDYRYNNDVWTPLATNATLTRSLTATTDSTKTTLEFRIRAKNTSNVYSDYIYSPIYTIQHNVAPVVTLDTENNKTLYENDSFKILGAVQDTDNGNTVTVRYQISGGTERAIKAYLSNGSVELFSKTLTFKGGKLYDGETLIVGDLLDGTAYTLRVWATDDKGGTSAIAERTFYVVPNRAPLLTVNTPVIEGNIDADTIQITGTFSDPDGNNAKVSYRINSGNSVQVAEGTSGVFDFTVSFGQLVIGENTIVIEVVDSYGAKITKTIKLNKTLTETPLLKNTERYRLLPPSGSAAGVLFYVQRNEQLAIEVAISMTQAAEAEQFTSLSPVTTAPLSQGSAIVEDEFYHAIPEPVDNIILQIDFTRTTTTADEKIYVIMGAFN